VYIPTAFSPNNDGINDNFTIFATNPTAFNLKVYNRWGQVIFESFDIQHTWNGTYQGEAVPMDSYVYTLEVVMPNGKHYHKQGIINVIK
jgi:gliding motility-associated-like protein